MDLSSIVSGGGSDTLAAGSDQNTAQEKSPTSGAGFMGFPSIAGSVFNAAESNAANQWNSQQAQDVRTWETNMSNTAHQREVADLKAAGLNPILSASHGGATTPSSPAASASVPQGVAMPDVYSNLVRLDNETGVAKTQQQKNLADAGVSQQEIRKLQEGGVLSNILGTNDAVSVKGIMRNFVQKILTTIDPGKDENVDDSQLQQNRAIKP